MKFKGRNWHADDHPVVVTLALLAVSLACFLGFWILHSRFEAEAYNRLTGKRVSTWDAMFLDLRVQEPVRQ